MLVLVPERNNHPNQHGIRSVVKMIWSLFPGLVSRGALHDRFYRFKSCLLEWVKIIDLLNVISPSTSASFTCYVTLLKHRLQVGESYSKQLHGNKASHFCVHSFGGCCKYNQCRPMETVFSWQLICSSQTEIYMAKMLISDGEITEQNKTTSFWYHLVNILWQKRNAQVMINFKFTLLYFYAKQT